MPEVHQSFTMLNTINAGHKKQTLIIYVSLIFITLAAFGQVTGFDFINVDDPLYVTENSNIQSGITRDGLSWAFSSTYAEYWHPLTWLSLMLDYQLYGLNAGGYHLTNVILHLLSTLLLFGLFNRMTGESWKSAFVAALFAIHPLNVEPVAWIAKRRDILSALFCIVTLYFYIHYTEKPVIKRYLFVLFSLLLALMCKPMVITVPVVMILLDYWPLDRFNLHRGKTNAILWQVKEKTPFFILSGVFSILTVHVHNEPSMVYFPLDLRFANALISFATYLEKIFWPRDLTVLHNFLMAFPIRQVLVGALLLLVVSIDVSSYMKRFPYLFVGWFWCLITILPVLGIIQYGFLAMSDHHTYLPSIGIAVCLAWGVPLLFPREEIRKKILFTSGLAVIALLTVLTWKQCSYWKNGIELFSHTLNVTRNNAFVYYYRGMTYVQLGQYQHAIEDFNETTRLKPYFSRAYYNRGIVFANLHQYRHAIDDFNKTIRLRPDHAAAYNDRGVIYTKLGLYRQSIEDFGRAITLQPDYAYFYHNRGLNYVKLHQYQMAIDDFSKAINLKKDDPEFYSCRGSVYFIRGNIPIACLDAQKACALGNCRLTELAKNKGYCR